TGFGLVGDAVAVGVARDRDGLAVRAGRRYRAVEQHAGAGFVGQHLCLAAVAVNHGHIGLDPVEDAVSVAVERDGPRLAIRAGNADRLAGNAALSIARNAVDRG